MSSTQIRMVGAGLCFLFIFFSGTWLKRTGKPYSVVISTIHKLIGLGLGVFLIVTVYRTHQVAPLRPAEIATVVVTALLFVADAATGGMLSVDRDWPAGVSIVHKLSSYLTVIATGYTLYLFS